MKSLEDYTFKSERAKLAIERIMAILRVTPMSREELSKTIHKSRNSVCHYLMYLRGSKANKTPRRIHICRWDESGGGFIPVYAAGAKDDAQEPKRKTSAERYARLRADKERHAQLLKRRRLAYASPRPREASMTNRIHRYLLDNHGMKAAEIALALAADKRHVVENLQRLKDRGLVELYALEAGRRPLYWRAAGYKPAEAKTAPVVIKQWHRTGIKPQTIFSALGL